MGGVKVEEMKELLGHSNIRCNSRVVLAFRWAKNNRGK
jgi:hypothetical protein